MAEFWLKAASGAGAFVVMVLLYSLWVRFAIWLWMRKWAQSDLKGVHDILRGARALGLSLAIGLPLLGVAAYAMGEWEGSMYDLLIWTALCQAGAGGMYFLFAGTGHALLSAMLRRLYADGAPIEDKRTRQRVRDAVKYWWPFHKVLCRLHGLKYSEVIKVAEAAAGSSGDVIPNRTATRE